ncbi:hypothetical protein BX600DRAFT_462793 [Xylariales sp. PMI_506]|nr:hypothetical protein BX600DRAFT_462793 [Xylariales sp. PMI_506]
MYTERGATQLGVEESCQHMPTATKPRWNGSTGTRVYVCLGHCVHVYYPICLYVPPDRTHVHAW